MTFKDLLRDTVQTLWSHKLRTLLTMFGIAWGIISIILMVGAGEGLRVGQARVSAGFGKNIMIVFAGRTSLQAGGMRAGRKVMWHATDHLSVKEQSPACQEILPELGTNIPVRSSYNSSPLWSPGLCQRSPISEAFLPPKDVSTTGRTRVKPAGWRFLDPT